MKSSKSNKHLGMCEPCNGRGFTFTTVGGHQHKVPCGWCVGLGDIFEDQERYCRTYGLTARWEGRQQFALTPLVASTTNPNTPPGAVSPEARDMADLLLRQAEVGSPEVNAQVREQIAALCEFYKRHFELSVFWLGGVAQDRQWEELGRAYPVSPPAP